MAVIKVTDSKPLPPVIMVTVGSDSTIFKISEYTETFYGKVAKTTKSC